ncbi:MAG: MBL fold metallo-hydrolase [Armatimonadetes bacterium]|nr:MBL fold metallo-hydrolase [Armatimonadota bacterium]
MVPGTFTLTVLNIPDIDRGVGLAIILQTPCGRTVLYDTGTGYPQGDGWQGDCNTGRDQIAPFLAARGIEALDAVIISHAHYDHFGGLLWLADRVPINLLIDSGYDFTGPRDTHYNRELADYTDLREGFRQRPGAYRAVLAGDRLELDDELQIEVIAPPAGYFHESHPETRPAQNPPAHYMLNSNSLMLRIRHGDLIFLLPGDIEKDDQARFLIPSVPPGTLACDLLVAPGHGLHTAPEFVEATRPKVTIVSLFRRWIGSCTALDGFRRVGSQVFVTGLNGTVNVISDGQSMRVETETR